MQRFPKAVLIPSLSPCDSSNRANRRRFPFRRPNRRALLVSGGFTGAGGWGSLRLGRLVYILYTIRLGWSRLGLGLPKRLWSCGFLYLRRAAFRGRRREGVEEGYSFGVAFCDISGGFSVLVCGDGVRSVFYQLVKLGWFPLPTSSGGLLPLRGVSLSGEMELSTAEASDIRFSGNVMAFDHLVRHARSASKVCVGIAGVPLWVPLKICVFSSGGWSASTRLFRPSATRTSGRSLQGRGCIFCICQGCLCKCWNVNH